VAIESQVQDSKQMDRSIKRLVVWEILTLRWDYGSFESNSCTI